MLSLSTDENATCAYSSSDIAYASMTAFTTTGALSHSASVTSLVSGLSYTYYVRCLDMFGNVNATSSTISFSIAELPPSSANWYQAAWLYRKPVTVNHTQVAGVLSNFPVLISVTDLDLKAKASASGNDILFALGDGTTKLNHEVEKYDPTTGTLVAWVNVPSLSSSADTPLYVYFGNAAAANQANAPGTWDSSFKAVWHLKESPVAAAPQFKDSTSNGNHGAANGAMTAAAQGPGMISGSLTFNGSSNFVGVPDASSLDGSNAVTVSTWVRTTAGGFNLNLVNKGNGCINGGYVLMLNENAKGTAMPSFWVGSSGWIDAAGVNLSHGAWHYVAATNDGTTTAVYVDGVLKASGLRGGLLNTATQLRIAYGVCGNYFAGSLDEVRISGSARPAAWIATEYANESAPQTFAPLGALQVKPN
jgi:hypothetical protein